MCGWCKDRWGFSWQITPRRLLEADERSGSERGKRAFQAMMTMRKIDIAAIEAAAEECARVTRRNSNRLPSCNRRYKWRSAAADPSEREP